MMNQIWDKSDAPFESYDAYQPAMQMNGRTYLEENYVKYLNMKDIFISAVK